MTLQRRVSLAMSLIVALLVLVLCALAIDSLDEQEDEIVNQMLVSEASRVANRIADGSLSVPVGNANLAIAEKVLLTRVEVAERGPSVANAGQPLLESVRHWDAHGRTIHGATLLLDDRRLFLEYDATANEERVHEFAFHMMFLGAMCIVLGILVARYLSRLMVAPLSRMTARLAAWAPGLPSVHIAGPDEEAQLLEAFNRAQERFELTIADERTFASNVAHEIRTPLAALRTDIEMLMLQPDLPAIHQERLRAMLSASDAAASGLTSALALSKRQPLRGAEIDLSQCVDDVWLSLGHASHEHVRFVNAVATGETIVGDRHALMTILRNLVRNASEHAAPTRCTVSGTRMGLEVVDDGPGIAAEDLPFVFERYWRGRLTDAPQDAQREERGLGLAIAKQMADLNGWTLSADSAPGQGSRFALQFLPR